MEKAEEYRSKFIALGEVEEYRSKFITLGVVRYHLCSSNLMFKQNSEKKQAIGGGMLGG